MVSNIAVTIFALQLFISNVVANQSPCPNFFRYYQDMITKEFMALVEIPSPPKGIVLHLRLTLSIARPLPTRYVGRVELVKTKKESIEDVQAGRSLFYRIHFPLQRPIPVLTSLYFNNMLFCEGIPALGPLTTAIFLEHTLLPPRKSLCPHNNTDNSLIIEENIQANIKDFVTSNNKLESTQIYQKPIHTSPKSVLTSAELIQTTLKVVQMNLRTAESTSKNNQHQQLLKTDDEILVNCGILTNFRPLFNEKKFINSANEWPWLAIIYLGIEENYEFQCVGNLVSDKHVITAAHCVKYLVEDSGYEVILVSLGRLSLTWVEQNDTIDIQVMEVIIHPDYSNLNADADLAILVLMETVRFGPTIRPICLWSGSHDFDKIVGKSGYVITWGSDEKTRFTSKPTLTKVPIVSQETCLRSNYTFLQITSNRTFCAGSRNGSGPCNGDSGSGLIIYNHNTKKFHLRGIVSFSLINKTTMACDLSQYIIYVDTAKYFDWIRIKIRNSTDIDVRID